jgi:hypothetical protein
MVARIQMSITKISDAEQLPSLKSRLVISSKLGAGDIVAANSFN